MGDGTINSTPVFTPDFRPIFESLPGLYMVLSPDLRIIAATDAYLNATMTTRDAILGHNLFDVFPDNPADPAASGVNNLRDSLACVLETRQPHTMAVQKYDIRRPESEGGEFEERYWSPMNSPVVGADGRVEYIIHRVQDVTDFIRVKRLEEQQAEVTDALRQRTRQMEMEVYRRAEDLSLANRQLHQTNAVLKQLYAEIAKLTTGPEGDAAVSAREEIAPVEMLARITRLIAGRNQLEEQLRQAQKMEAIGRLAGGIAHDFNNLLTVILGYGGLLKEVLDPGPALDSVDQIEQAAARASALTTQLLAFSRKQVLQLRVLDLNAVIGGMREFLQRLIGEDVRLQIELDGHLPDVKADPTQMEQVVMNLAVNARDAMPSGGCLLITTRNMAVGAAGSEFMPVKPGRYAVLNVSDTGQGMDAETRARIFEPFFTTKESGKGTGLGLATVFGVVEQSGGTITVSSEPGEGATFSIFLPAESQETEPEPSAAKTVSVRPGAGTILLVEDEDSLRRLIQGILKESGYQVLPAASGEEALEISQHYRERIDVLLTDVIMPGMKGPDMAACLQKDRPGMIVLFMSGYDQNLMGQELFGPVNFLAKPFTPKALAEMVCTLLGVRRSSTEA